MKHASVLLVYPQPAKRKEWRFGFSLNLLYVAAILSRSGYEVRYVDYAAQDFNENQFINMGQHADVVILEFDAFPLKRTLNLPHGEMLMRIVRERCPRARIIALGYDCILSGEVMPLADYTFTSEWEGSIVKVLDALLQHGSANDVTIQNVQDLDCLPHPARELLSPRVERGGDAYRLPHLARSTLIQTSRGCQNTCRFCQRHGWFSHFHAHSIDYSLAEFRALHEMSYVNIWIADENFTFNLDRAKGLLRCIAGEIKNHTWKMALSSWVHIDREMIDLCHAAGVSIISFGIESANQNIQRFYNKYIDLNHAGDIISYADQAGIYCVGNFILGAPMENVTTIQQSIEFAKSFPFDQINVKILDYMIGSDLYETLPADLKNSSRHVFACKKHGLCAFWFDELREYASSFADDVMKHHKSRICAKILRCGPPYIAMPLMEFGKQNKTIE